MTIRILKSNMLPLNTDLRKRLFFGLLGFAGLTFFVYIYLIGQIVFNVVERRNAETELKFLSNSLSQLEFKYLSKSREINLEYAKNLGFKEPQKIGFVGRTTLTKNTLSAKGGSASGGKNNEI